MARLAIARIASRQTRDPLSNPTKSSGLPATASPAVVGDEHFMTSHDPTATPCLCPTCENTRASLRSVVSETAIRQHIDQTISKIIAEVGRHEIQCRNCGTIYLAIPKNHPLRVKPGTTVMDTMRSCALCGPYVNTLFAIPPKT